MRSFMVLGFLGRQQAGKDTSADYLEEYGFVRASIAQPLKTLCMLGEEAIKNKIPGVKITERHKAVLPWSGSKAGDGRWLLQDIAMQGRKYDPFFWVNMLVNNIYTSTLETYDEIPEDFAIAITDVRLATDVVGLRRLAREWPYCPGYSCIVKLERDSIEKSDHITEREVDRIQTADLTIKNNGTIEDLHRELDKLVTRTLPTKIIFGK